MVKKRNYKKYKGNRKKYYQAFQKQLNVFLLIGLILIFALITFKNYPQFVYTALVKNDRFTSSGLDYKSIEKILLGEDRKSKTNLDSNYKEVILGADRNSKKERAVIAGSISELKQTNFTEIDNYAFSIRYDGTSVFELASLLSHYTKTEAEKARIIYSWIAYNITYDVPAYLSGNYGDLSPQGVLKTRTGVCSGYANLYKALARAMGLDVVVVEGYAKGYGYVIGNTTQINHAWNTVKITNKWYLIDSTWGAGSINGGKFNRQFNPYYFATPPKQFILDHFPTESRWQLLATHYTKQQYDTIPEISPQFFRDGLHLISPHNHTIQTSGRFEVVLSAPEDIIAISKLKSGSEYLNNNYTFIQKKGNKIVISVAPPVGNYELEIFSKNKHFPGAYHHAITYKVLSRNAGEEFPMTYSSFLEKNSYLYAPLNKYLPARAASFKIEVPQALEVQVIDVSSNKWIKLTRSGSIFTGNVPVSSDKIQVSAKFPGNEDYWTLVEYN